MAQADAASKIPAGAANKESIPARTGILVVRAPDLFGDYFDLKEPAIVAAKTTQPSRWIKRLPKRPLVEVTTVNLIDDPEPEPTPAAELEDQDDGCLEK